MTDVVGNVGAVSAGAVSWAAGLPTFMVVLVLVGSMLMPSLRAWLLAREQTRREAAAWRGAVAVYLVDGDGAAVARGLRGVAGSDLRPEPDVR